MAAVTVTPLQEGIGVGSDIGTGFDQRGIQTFVPRLADEDQPLENAPVENDLW